MWFQSLEVKLMPGDTGSCCISSLKSSRWWSMFAVYGGNRFMNPSIRRNWLPRIQKKSRLTVCFSCTPEKGGKFPPMDRSYPSLNSCETTAKLCLGPIFSTHLVTLDASHLVEDMTRTFRRSPKSTPHWPSKKKQIRRDMIPWIIFNLFKSTHF